MAETITGTLQRERRRKADRDWVKDYARTLAEEAGLVPVHYWPETVYVLGDERTEHGRPMLWSAPEGTKAFGDIPNGARVRFVAVVKRWTNGIGGDISRIRNVESRAQ